MMSDLKHVGVLGMRWGVRRLKREDGEIVRKAGETVHHISDKPEIILKEGSFYSSFTKKDILHYRGDFGDELMFNRNVSKVYDHAYKTKVDLISPSKKKAVDLFLDLAKKDPNLLNDISASKSKSSVVLSLAKMFGADKKRAEEYRRLVNSKNPEDNEKMFKEHMAYMLLDNKIQKKYFDALSKKGFNSVYDFNDILNGRAEKPLIIFDAQSKLLFSEKESLNWRQTWDSSLELINIKEEEKKGG